MFEESAIAEDIRNGRSMSTGAVEEASRLIEQFFWEKAAEQSLLRVIKAPRHLPLPQTGAGYFRRIAGRMRMDSIGFDWPYPMDWLWLGSAVLVFLFALHARRLFLTLPFYSAFRLFVLRALGGIFFFC